MKNDGEPPKDDESLKDGEVRGKLLILPGGKRIDTDDIGMKGVLIGSSGTVSTAEVLDPRASERELREREDYVKRQELVQAATRRGAASEMVELAIVEIAEELAHLKFERRKAAKEGKPIVQHTIARIAMLRNLADVLLKRQENSRAERMDFRSPEFKKVIHQWLEFVHESMQKAGVKDNDIDLTFRQIEADMADWEKRIFDNFSSKS
jgi:hypothetical protein